MQTTKVNRAVPNINVTPLIDVLLVLLIIFMVISPKKPHKYEAKLPEKSQAEQTQPELMLVVSVSRENGLLLNQTKAQNLAELNSLLHTALDARPLDRKAVFLKGSPNMNYGAVAEVIDTIKESGAAPIGLQLEALE